MAAERTPIADREPPSAEWPGARLDYVIDPAERLITITGDYATGEEWKRLLARAFHDPRLERGFGLLRDLRHTRRPVDHATTVGIVDAIRRFWPLLQPSAVAVLTPDDFDPGTLHHLAGLYRLPVRAFTAHHTAVAWVREQG